MYHISGWLAQYSSQLSNCKWLYMKSIYDLSWTLDSLNHFSNPITQDLDITGMSGYQSCYLFWRYSCTQSRMINFSKWNHPQHCTVLINIIKLALSAPFRKSLQQTKPASLSSREPAQCNPKSINSIISIFSNAQGKNPCISK